MDDDKLFLLSQRINILKNDIQIIISKNIISDELNELKNSKLKELNNCLEQTKELNTSSSLHNGNVTSRMNNRFKIKSSTEENFNRKIVNNTFKDYQKLDELYEKYDSKELPAFIFMYEKYTSLCPYLLITENIEENEQIFKNRKIWLKSQDDREDIYSKMFNKLILKSDILKAADNVVNLENQIDILLTDHSILTLEDKSMIKTNLEQYLSCSVKTKIIKRKYKDIIEILSKIYNKTNINIHEYYSAKYDLQIPVNTSSVSSLLKTDIMSKEIALEFNSLIQNYSNMVQEEMHSKRYLENTLKNLKISLYEHLSILIKNANDNNINKEHKDKKWVDFTDDQKVLFVKIYIEKFIKDIGNVQFESEDIKKNVIETFSKNIVKNVPSKYLSWCPKSARIVNIKLFKYNKESGEFYLQEHVSEPKKTSKNKTSMNNNMEVIINKDLSSLMLSERNNILSILSKADKERLRKKIIDKIKSKNNIRKFNLIETKEINKKFEDFYSILKEISTEED